jgi:hypothetical protein
MGVPISCSRGKKFSFWVFLSTEAIYWHWHVMGSNLLNLGRILERKKKEDLEESKTELFKGDTMTPGSLKRFWIC